MQCASCANAQNEIQLVELHEQALIKMSSRSAKKKARTTLSSLFWNWNGSYVQYLISPKDLHLSAYLFLPPFLAFLACLAVFLAAGLEAFLAAGLAALCGSLAKLSIGCLVRPLAIT